MDRLDIAEPDLTARLRSLHPEHDDYWLIVAGDEVSVGYPREWRRPSRRGWLRRILPEEV
jgi:hypothetical protein